MELAFHVARLHDCLDRRRLVIGSFSRCQLVIRGFFFLHRVHPSGEVVMQSLRPHAKTMQAPSRLLLYRTRKSNSTASCAEQAMAISAVAHRDSPCAERHWR